MPLHHTTPVPNQVFDSQLAVLSLSELKVLLIIIRQTYGWFDKRTGKRKARDWIALKQFEAKTGLSRRAVSGAIESLIRAGLIQVSDVRGNDLGDATDRRGQKIYFSYANAQPKLRNVHLHSRSASKSSELVQKLRLTKEKPREPLHLASILQNCQKKFASSLVFYKPPESGKSACIGLD